MAVEYKDYYKILGVNKNADQNAIRQAFRKLARQYHPDVNSGDKVAEDRFKEINEANEVLSDPEKRKKYDEMASYYQQYGSWPGAGQQERQASASGGGFSGGNYQYYTMNEEDLGDLFGGNSSPFSDFFETYFHSGFDAQSERRSRSRRQTQATRGNDAESKVDVSLAEAYQGTSRILELSQPDGSKRRLEVKIPAGVDEGSRIRIAGQGFAGTAGNGDLYLLVHLLPDEHFVREGTTLHERIDVPLTTAMLGGEVAVPTPDGRRLMLRIPPGTANGRSFRLRGKGMPQLGKAEVRGDLYADVSVQLPTQLTQQQRQLFEAFARSLDATDTQQEKAGNHV
ncbi:DnaJ C-terminal domain-containing protein [Tengunoibacter tsumagoiensis]|uniref:Molecular chaperone DnaJ n=1 Tax=Tengunoibacter tsumagoiensis TaxID=2014871 RepID=A0A402AAT5_9CHLR|nr:J domain-containing protein [Tengunoibacter tsumagoiensis]GCE16051.1 molecular chaperone DnaJ [Tengunoibacter tsumagoiensis]